MALSSRTEGNISFSLHVTVNNIHLVKHAIETLWYSGTQMFCNAKLLL